MTLVQRQISLQFTLSSGDGQQKTFAESGTDTVKLDGLRVSARIVKAGGLSMGSLNARIYGMTLSLMNQLSTLGIRFNTVPRNAITVSAGDVLSGMTTVFVGSVQNGWADFGSAPEVPFVIEGKVGLPDNIQSAKSTSYNGPVAIASAMASLANQMSLHFENSGVTGNVDSPYLWGSLRNQAQQLADAAGISWTIDNGTLAIWPKGGKRNGQIPLLSPQTGMIGYPSYTEQGVLVRSIYNPSIGIGQQVKVQSSLGPASATWTVYNLEYELDAFMPHGQWSMNVYCYSVSGPRPVLS